MFTPIAKKQILIVDQDGQFVNELIHILEDHGFDTLTATNAEVAVQKAATLDVDMILLGEGLPDSRGIDFCETLKSNRNTDHIPVIVFTGEPITQERIKGYYLGADDYLIKTIDKEELLARMEAIWRRGNGTPRTHREERQRQVVQELAKIIDKGLIQPHFQPIYYLKPFRLFGFEVLSRPIETVILTNAEDLFKAAAKYDMYYALEMVCWQKAVDIVSSQTKSEHIFFNCSPRIVENSKFSAVKTMFEKSKIPLDKVVLEITERSSIVRYDLFYKRLKEYRESGFSFAVDDVGGGYASLESIAATKPEIVKIDAHIVRDIYKDPVKKSIVKFIVAFCKDNRISSVAEGVETEEEMDAVSDLGIDAVQGYYLFRPTPEMNLRKMKDIAINFS